MANEHTHVSGKPALSARRQTVELPEPSQERDTVSQVTPQRGSACNACMSLLEADTRDCSRCGAPRPGEGWVPAHSLGDAWIGRTIANTYRVVRLLGKGGMGRVYEAQSMTVERSFAVKIVNPTQKKEPTQSGETLRNRLKREIKAQSTLRSPHLLPLFDAILLPDDHVAMVMDLIEGNTLLELVGQRGPLPVLRACDIVRQVANGLQKAHERGIIHRDLKPENIMVEALPSGDDFARVFDFGIVSFTGDASKTKGFIGTPLYASPEQAGGRRVDSRSDIYSLGGVFFFMLTGKPPFDVRDMYDALKAHLYEPAPKLGQVLPCQMFPDALEDLVARMLAKEPDERPASMSELIAELDDLRSSLDQNSSLELESVASLEERSAADTVVPNTTTRGDCPADNKRPVPGAAIIFTPRERKRSDGSSGD